MGQERPRRPGPSRPLSVPGEAGSWAVSRRPVLRGLRGLRCWIRAPHREALSPWSRCSSPSELLRVQPCMLQPFRELGRWVWRSPLGAGVCYCPREPEGIPTLLGPAPTPREPLSAREDWSSSCFSRIGLSCPGDTRPSLSPAPRGAPLPWMPFVSLFLFSPSSFLDRSANSSHCSVPAVLSLNLRPNS